MRLAIFAISILVLLGALGWTTDAARAADGACPVWQAERDVKAAKRAVARAEARLSEARRVLAETKRATALYGNRVGRWVRLSRRVGWPWAEFATLTRIIDAESGGIPTAVNSSSGCAGLLQLAPCWYDGRWQFDPYNPRLNLRYGLRVWRLCSWDAWSTY